MTPDKFAFLRARLRSASHVEALPLNFRQLVLEAEKALRELGQQADALAPVQSANKESAHG